MERTSSVVVEKQAQLDRLTVDVNATPLKAFLKAVGYLEQVENGKCLVAVNGTLVRDVEAIGVQSGDTVLVVPKVVGG